MSKPKQKKDNLNIVAKLQCWNVVKVGKDESVTFSAVPSAFSTVDLTGGSLTLIVSNPSLLGTFEKGKNYYVNFRSAP
jgi:hypothetical protein